MHYNRKIYIEDESIIYRNELNSISNVDIMIILILFHFEFPITLSIIIRSV